MRIFHLADLHIGKKLNYVSLVEDQQFILEQIIEAIEQNRPDVIILAGDIYDRRNPSIEAIAVLDDFLSRVIIDHGIPALAIGGNHDSGERLSFANGILARAGLHMQGRLTLPIPKVDLYDQLGKVSFYLLPYADLATIKHEMKDEDLADYQQGMAAVIETINHQMDKEGRNVLIAHGVVVGSEPLDRSDSERELTIGGTEYWESYLLSDFDYVALGHLHQHQSAGSEHIRYSGSMMKYSFSEEKQIKCIVQIDLLEKGKVSYSAIPIKPLRDMVTLTGTLEQLTNPVQDGQVYSGYFVRAVLTDEGELLEPMSALKKAYPHILTLERANQPQLLALDESAVAQVNLQQQSPIQLFEQFYGHMTNETLNISQLELLKTILKEAEVNE